MEWDLQPPSHQCFSAKTHHRVQPAFGWKRIQPLVDAVRFACHADQPGSERRQCTEREQHLDAGALGREAVFEGLPVAMRLEIAKRQFDLHPSRIQRDQLARAEREVGRGRQQPGLALTLRDLAAVRIARRRTLLIAMLATFGRLRVKHHVTVIGALRTISIRPQLRGACAASSYMALHGTH